MVGKIFVSWKRLTSTTRNTNAAWFVKTNDELTKNHRAHDVQAEEGGIMIANDSPYCLVSSFEKYFSVLNPMNEWILFSATNVIWKRIILVWQHCCRREHSRQEDESKQQAELSTTYTNNSIDHFTVVRSVIWPLNGSEAGDDLVLIQTSLFLLCKSSCYNAN